MLILFPSFIPCISQLLCYSTLFRYVVASSLRCCFDIASTSRHCSMLLPCFHVIPSLLRCCISLLRFFQCCFNVVPTFSPFHCMGLFLSPCFLFPDVDPCQPSLFFVPQSYSDDIPSYLSFFFFSQRCSNVVPMFFPLGPELFPSLLH